MKSNSSLILFGPNGILAPAWIKAAREINLNIIGVGLDEPMDDSNLSEFYKLDVTNYLDSELIEILTRTSPKHIIYNSGIDSRPGTGKSKVEEYDITSWNDILDVNLLGFVRIMNTILLSKLSPINIVVVGSLYASVSPNYQLYSHFNSGRGQIKHPAYSASKSALKSVMKQYSTLLAKEGIRINMLSPGGVAANQDQQFIDNFSSTTPIGRLAKSEELVSSMKFLLDESNSYLVGHDLLIDGGYSSW